LKNFVLRDKALQNKIVGTMTYDTADKRFGMTIDAGIPPGDLPLSLELLVCKGENEIGHDRAIRWVRSRICPPARQNIREILRGLGVGEYDEFAILAHTKAVCYNDDVYMEEIYGEATEMMELR